MIYAREEIYWFMIPASTSARTLLQLELEFPNASIRAAQEMNNWQLNQLVRMENDILYMRGEFL